QLDSWTYDVAAGDPVPDMDETYQLVEAGTYNFQATFTPDDGDPISSPCGTETVNVGTITPELTTTIFADGDEVEPGSRLTRPTDVADGVLFGFGDQDLDGVDGPDGTIIYTLYNDSGCEDSVFSDEQTVNDGQVDGSDSYSLTESDSGVYNWVVTFTPSDEEVNFTSAESGCGTETFFLDAGPTLTTTMFSSEDGDGDGSELENGGTLTVGDSVRDTATLSDDTGDATGTVTFTLHQGLDCDGEEMFSETVEIEDGEAATSWYEL